MTKLLPIVLLICSSIAAATGCKDGTLEAVGGTRCSRYAECERGTWQLKECEFGQIFDSETLKCVSRSVAKMGACKKGSKCSEGITYSHPGSTRMFYRCINGRVSLQLCRVGEVFHPDLQSCQVDEAFQHPGLNRPKRDADEACEEGSKRRDGKSCKDYFECVDGQEVKKTCVDCMNFDDKTQTCRFVFLTPCAGPTTTTPQPETTTPEPETKTDPPTTTPQPDTTTPEPETKTDPPTTTPQPDPTTPEPETKTDPPTTTPQPETTTPEPETKTDPPTTDTPTTTPEPETTTPTEIPTTTVAPCKEGEKVGIVDPDCKAYKECKNGVWVNDSCGWWRKFDAIKKECEYTWFHKITCAS